MMENLPRYDAWRLAEPPAARDDVPRQHRVTIELCYRALVPPADAAILAERTARQLAQALRQVPDANLVEVVGARVIDLWQEEGDE